jgi:orotidine-5'-phosphate decarboxylase
MQTEQLIPVSIEESVLHYANLAHLSGLDGVVCSTWEAKKIHHYLGAKFLTVTPGIRLNTDNVQDQKRVATPDVAKAEGVSAIVVGRPITRAKDPLQSYLTFKQAWEVLLQ